jgi:hypothetical protein
MAAFFVFCCLLVSSDLLPVFGGLGALVVKAKFSFAFSGIFILLYL